VNHEKKEEGVVFMKHRVVLSSAVKQLLGKLVKLLLSDFKAKMLQISSPRQLTALPQTL